MARTNAADVKNAIDTSLTDAQVSAFIDDASVVVDDIASADATITSAKLTLIEKYLAAHFVTLRDPRLTKAALADVQESYQRDAEMTEYLKAAIALDPTGIIEDAFTDRPVFGFRVSAGYDDDLTKLPAT